jgi:hypothetical protein
MMMDSMFEVKSLTHDELPLDLLLIADPEIARDCHSL